MFFAQVECNDAIIKNNSPFTCHLFLLHTGVHRSKTLANE